MVWEFGVSIFHDELVLTHASAFEGSHGLVTYLGAFASHNNIDSESFSGRLGAGDQPCSWQIFFRVIGELDNNRCSSPSRLLDRMCNRSVCGLVNRADVSFDRYRCRSGRRAEDQG